MRSSFFQQSHGGAERTTSASFLAPYQSSRSLERPKYLFIAIWTNFRSNLLSYFQAFIYAWMSKIALGLDYEETTRMRKNTKNDTPPGPGSSDVFPLEIVTQCVYLMARDIYEYGEICVFAPEIIERLARLIKDEDRSSFRSQLLKFMPYCMQVRHEIFCILSSPHADEHPGISSSRIYSATCRH